ncbi:flagellar biosynthetic protein FliQ [Burkholderia sp. WAC0059]|uniref:flagellar biosynthesis protein FliQ n=1 Tax=Burkholderia sp. WAC0059 TaxID=2066022 RepID=UPI000C7EAD42|nr:flagellar biosynthesis protein FliQ [Burkholderia sp. WAC0059]PLZ00670.1 flagellar biosynthetic protein FliQ [Burkholderia sp. WAC0059]
MTPEYVMTLAHEAMYVTLLLAAPLLLVSLVVGLIVSLFQAATQINEATLSFIPKAIAIAVTLVLIGPWMLTTILDYMRHVFTNIPSVANSG